MKNYTVFLILIISILFVYIPRSFAATVVKQTNTITSLTTDTETIQIPKNSYVVVHSNDAQLATISYKSYTGTVAQQQLTATTPTVYRVKLQAQAQISEVANASTKLKTIYENDYITHYGTVNNWSFIRSGATYGYVPANSITRAKGETMVVSHEDGVVVRQLPDYKDQPFTTISKGTKIEVFRKKVGDFTFIEANGVIGYVVHNRLKQYSVPFGKYNASKIQTPKKRVALTFDDGPNAKVTPQILNILERYGAKATFFVVGKNISANEQLLKRTYLAGHEIGNHSWNHAKFTSLSYTNILSQLTKTNNAVFSITNVSPTVMRPTYGAYNTTVLKASSVPLILWSVDTLDWKHRNPDKTLAAVKKYTKNGSIILMHDIHQPTADSLDRVLSYLTEAGYECVTVSELLTGS